ncbi:MAG: site-specific integrase [Bacillota bacterium]|nr:site-specific integrase [Bacillota bacterium]
MGHKRGNGEGTISRRKDGTWCSAISAGRNPVTGKPIRSFFYGRTRQEVADKLAKALSDARQGVFVKPTKVTVGQWLDTWLNEYARPHVRATTWGSYEYIIRCHLKPALGSIPLKDLRPEHLQRLYNQKLATGRVDGEGQLSSRTVRLIHITLHAALKQAVKEGLTVRNVSEATSPPRQQKREIRALSPQEQQDFLKTASADRLGVAFVLDLATGLRRGELLGLRWADVDFGAETVTVRQALVEVRTGNAQGPKTALVFQEPKSASGRRTIPLPSVLIPQLKAHKARQNEEKLLLGAAYHDQGLVFATADGKPIHPRNFTRKFYQLASKAGISGTNLHALRHSFATRLLEANEHPKVVQELLGHSQISQTLDTYSHVSLNLKRSAADKLNQFLAP